MRMRSTKRLGTGLVVLAILQTAACDNSATEPEDPGFAWAGVYQSEVQATDGGWLAAGTIEVTKDGRVLVDGIEMVNVNLGEASALWTMKGGNPHTSVIAFLDGSLPNGAWPEGQEGVLFQGWIEYPEVERRTWRGLRR
jgi:hypothetical protein